MLSEQSIAKYREIYRKETGEEISHEQASEQAQRLLNVARVVLAPMPATWLPKYNELLERKNNSHD